MVTEQVFDLDDLDRSLIALLRRDARMSISELARRTDQPRATVLSRQQRLERRRVISGYGPDIDAARIGFGVTAFATLEIAQGSHESTVARLREVVEVLEIHTVTGVGDLHLRIIARSNAHLHEILQRVTSIDSVMRSQTQIALSTQLQRSTADVVAAAITRRSAESSGPMHR